MDAFPLLGRVFVPTSAVCQTPAGAEPLLFHPAPILVNPHSEGAGRAGVVSLEGLSHR